MIILSHRGYWKTKTQQNSRLAFEKSFSSGFGIETDIRDYGGQLVISHDMPTKNCMFANELFKIYNKTNVRQTLALNIKADGLHHKLKDLLDKYELDNYFIFDMSVPDGLGYLKLGFKVFTRQSEYEKSPSFYEKSDGIWLDEFHNHWIDAKTIKTHAMNKKKICIVSPELHARNYLDEWNDYRSIVKKSGITDIMICTDHPAQAEEFFNGKN